MLLPTSKEMRPGGALDLGSLKGCIRCFFLGWICFFGIWYATEVSDFIEGVLGIYSDPPSLGKIRFQKFLAFSLAGTAIVVSFIVGLNIYIKQIRVKKSTRGQWYDKENLTYEDLYGDKEDLEESAESPDARPPH